jgi:DNA-binding protein HU-beta
MEAEMKKLELIAKIAAEQGMGKPQVRAITKSLLKSIVSAAANGEEVAFGGFGKFTVKQMPEREARDPTSGKTTKIAASKKLIYSPAKSVKELLNG